MSNVFKHAQLTSKYNNGNGDSGIKTEYACKTTGVCNLNSSNLRESQQNWINCGKLLAIIAVIVDHTNGVFYSSTSISVASYFSVSLFVLLGGVTTYYSNVKNRSRRGFLETVRRLRSILIPYVVATGLH